MPRSINYFSRGKRVVATIMRGSKPDRTLAFLIYRSSQCPQWKAISAGMQEVAWAPAHSLEGHKTSQMELGL